MEMIKQAQIGTATLRLEARDQYNDYSVIYDYTLILVDRANNVHRTWYSGKNRADALELFERAIPIVRKLQA